MSIVCNLCGGQLVMDAGGQSAACPVCGMKYSLECVREKAREAMAGGPAADAVPVPVTVPVPAAKTAGMVKAPPTALCRGENDPDVYDVEDWTVVEEPDEPERPEDFVCRREPGWEELRVLVHYTGWNRVVTIPNGVGSLGEWEGIVTTQDQSPGNPGVFLHPERIRRVILPEGLFAIGPLAFRGCVNLEELVLPSSLGWFSADLSDCRSLRSLVFRWARDMESDVLEGAFEGCASLEKVTFPNDCQLQCIPDSMFQDCTGLREIVIPWSVVKIHKDAFKNCSHLTRVVLPDHEMLIHPSAFAGCPYQPPLEALQPRKLAVCPLCGGKATLTGFCKNCGAPMRLSGK